MVLDVERLEGRLLVDAMDKFVVESCGSCSSCTNYPGLMALITIFGRFNQKEKEGTSGFKHARRLHEDGTWGPESNDVLRRYARDERLM
jgi:NADH:ubiquinone oxidoreductase subunit F (NADH-binding)